MKGGIVNLSELSKTSRPPSLDKSDVLCYTAVNLNRKEVET